VQSVEHRVPSSLIGDLSDPWELSLYELQQPTRDDQIAIVTAFETMVHGKNKLIEGRQWILISDQLLLAHGLDARVSPNVKCPDHEVGNLHRTVNIRTVADYSRFCDAIFDLQKHEAATEHILRVFDQREAEGLYTRWVEYKRENFEARRRKSVG
jgi:hypothetical protein